MGVNVDKSRGYQQAACVDLLGAGAFDLTDRGDLAPGNCDIAFVAGAAGSIDNRSAAYHAIEPGHARILSRRFNGSIKRYPSGPVKRRTMHARNR